MPLFGYFIWAYNHFTLCSSLKVELFFLFFIRSLKKLLIKKIWNSKWTSAIYILNYVYYTYISAMYRILNHIYYKIENGNGECVKETTTRP